MMGRGQVCDIVLEMFGWTVLLHAGRASRASPPRLVRVLGFLEAASARTPSGSEVF